MIGLFFLYFFYYVVIRRGWDGMWDGKACYKLLEDLINVFLIKIFFWLLWFAWHFDRLLYFLKVYHLVYMKAGRLKFCSSLRYRTVFVMLYIFTIKELYGNFIPYWKNAGRSAFFLFAIFSRISWQSFVDRCFFEFLNLTYHLPNLWLAKK